MTSLNSLTVLSAKTGFGGLVSGMDIDELVKSYTSTSRSRIFKEQQTVQKLQWKQTAYRSVTKALGEFQKSYLDVLSSTNLRSSSFYNTKKATVSSSAVSVTPGSISSGSSITIDSISQLASSQRIASGASVSMPLQGYINSETPGSLTETDITNLLSSIGGKSISLTLDGRLRTLTFDEAFAQSVTADPTAEGLKKALQAAVDKAFGVTGSADRAINVSLSGNRLTISAQGSHLTVNAVGGDESTLNKLGLVSGQSNRLSLDSSIGDSFLAASLSPGTDTFKFSINRIDFEFRSDQTFNEIIREINNSDAGVTLAYSSLSDKFSLTAKETGAGENIVTAEAQGNLLSALGLTAGGGAKVTYGKNALLSVNGMSISRHSNNINIDGASVELLETTAPGAAPINISFKDDSSSLREPMEKFLEDYNALIDLISGLVSEKADRNYQPLSDEQKSDMTEKQIEQWEAKAKTGILAGDSVLKGILTDLRTAMSSAAKTGGIRLSDIGIGSGGYQDYGKLKIIDEAKFTEALRSRISDISELFTSSENGLAQRVNSIIEANIKKTGTKDNRGKLIMLAGVELSTSDKENNITKLIEQSNKRIVSFQDRLKSEESRLWKRFTAMETALQRLNVQSSMLTQFTSE
ncbi:hypothetical protein MASR2M70_22440 [Bacillota bacterium]